MKSKEWYIDRAWRNAASAIGNNNIAFIELKLADAIMSYNIDRINAEIKAEYPDAGDTRVFRIAEERLHKENKALHKQAMAEAKEYVRIKMLRYRDD